MDFQFLISNKEIKILIKMISQRLIKIGKSKKKVKILFAKITIIFFKKSVRFKQIKKHIR